MPWNPNNPNQLEFSFPKNAYLTKVVQIFASF